MDVISFFKSIGVDTGTHASGSFYTKCPKCHDERKKRSAKEFLVNLDTGYCECFHCGFYSHILSSGNHEKVDFTPPPKKAQQYISPEPVFNWVIPDAIIDPVPASRPVRGVYSVTWYYRNTKDKLTGAKKMEYRFDEKGMKRTDAYPVHLFTRDSGYYPCLFYERDLITFPSARIILVESEKTAALLRKKFKDNLNDFIFLATAGSNGLTDEKAKSLKGRIVMICYDCDAAGREGAQAAHTKLAGISQSYVVDINPQLNDGTDLADIETDIDYIRSLSGEQKYKPELIEMIRDRNRSGDPWNKAVADEVAQKILINLEHVYPIGKAYYEANKHEHGVDSAPLLKKVEYFLLQRYDFQRNSINKRVFYRDKSKKDAQFVFCNYNDIWRLCQHNLDQFGKKARVNITDISNLLESEFVEEVNPFTEYFHALPHWDGIDHIKKLSSYIQTTDQPFWETQFRKALIRMIACTYGHIENRIIMVLVQQAQEKGKDSWLRFLCPPQLREYYKEDPMDITKDSEIALCQNFMWNLPELDSMNKKEISEIKSIISRASVKQRRAYGRQEENMTRIVNFWGTTNKEEFLTDTQNTRWLCFRVESINHKYNDYINDIHEVDIDKVWAQAWYLYKSGEAFNLNEEERHKRDVINHSHEHMSPEKQLIIKFLTPCEKETAGAEFVTNVEVLEYLIAQTGNKLRLAPENVGRSMSQLDFKSAIKKFNGKTIRGYYAIRQPLLQSVNNYKSSPPPPAEYAPTIFGAVPDNDEEDVPF